jgi:hypothetical protein
MRKLSALALVVSSLAFAQTSKTQPAPKQPKPQEIDFVTGSLIDGERDVPFEQRFVAHTPPKFSTLIKVRMNFDDKLMQSVNEM